ncbi:MAG: triose-phosphate isomerase [Betaproteobacteria bacterium RBG_16_56_24]|nr:MAG: triose-phosphate isomerase [Betaproteobacteria bacterium RBG_16_56_24]
MTHRKLVAGNWKMHGALAQNTVLLDALRSGMTSIQNVDCAVCVPFPYLPQAQQKLSGSAVKWGAQDVHQMDKGAYTGEVSAAMLRDFGCSYAIVGHSERRAYYAESSHLVAEKFLAAQQAGIIPILCVGETLEQREKGITEDIVAGQLDALIQLGGVQALRNAVVAYEPVWAIGTGKTATAAQAQAVHKFIRQRVASHDGQIASGLCILYGGSVKANNAAELFAMPDIDGGLIGGASLVSDEFLAICRAGART